MPHATLKLVPGVNTTETPALNENAGVSQSQLVRWFYDSQLGALLQKLGGWRRFYLGPMAAIVRALWAWEDLNDTAHLAIGTGLVAPGNTQSNLSVLTNGSLKNITPVFSYSSIASIGFTVTPNQSYLTIDDSTTLGIGNPNTVYIPTQFSINGVVIFGLYQCYGNVTPAGTSYQIQATDILGNPENFLSSGAPTLPTFTTVAGSNVVEVNLPAYPYAVGTSFPVLLSTAVGGITLYGNYVISSIVDDNNFNILTNQVATSGTSQTLNGGSYVFIYGGPNNPNSSNPISAGDWTLDNFGEDLVACATQTIDPITGVMYQPIYLWNENQTAPPSVIATAPPVSDGIFVAMPQRQIVAWGTTETGVQDPLLLAWCDVNNPNQWIALVTNQAGTNRIPKGSRIVAGVQGPQQAVIWTDIDCWSMTYIGAPLVYSFNEIGTGCGLIARKAAASMNGIYYWMGPSQFYTLGGEGVLPLPCSVWDVVFQNLDQNNLYKIRVAVNSRFGEISWYYPSISGGTGEVDSYVKYNVYMNVWDYGTLGRTAWVDQSVLGPPIGADPSTLLLQQHETSNDADGAAMLPFYQTGYFTIAEGDFKTFIDLIWPDFKWGTYSGTPTATVQISFYVLNYPGDTPVVFGPYSVTQATKYFNTRLRGRLVAVRISSSDMGSFWRTGALRYRFAQDGKF
jgi:hypothetical protein